MAATERTPLTRATDSPNYVEFSNVLRTRTTRVRHFQCCVCATLLAIFLMALVIMVSYSVNHSINDMNDTSPSESAPNLLQSTWTLPNSVNNEEDHVMIALTDKEWNSGLSAGHEAIKQREAADAEATPLINPSPNSRHQFAVSTSVFAGKLALAGLAEIAATRTIEGGRLLLGEQSSIGAYFDGGWAPEGSCKEFANLICAKSKYRTFDGTCNHKKQWGSAFTPFRRSLPPEYGDGINSPRKGKFGNSLPSAREVSLRIHPPSPSSNPSFTVMLAVFGQFFDHDITATAISQGTNGSSLACCPPASGHPECFPVRVGPGDPVYDYTGNTCMEFVRSAPAPQCKIGPRQQLNQVSAFIDASAVYGATESAALNLRERVGGRLQMQRTPDNRTLLPPSRDPNDGCNRVVENMRGRWCFASGDARANENLHLTTMHLIWAREHNRVADSLASINPHWDDERLYQESRRIIGAELQHISYREFLPIVLGENATNKHNLKPISSGYRDDYDLNVNPAIANEFAAAAFRFAHTLLPGLMSMTNAAKGTSSYIELHKMLFNPYSLYAPSGVGDAVNSATTNVIQQTSTHVTSQLTRHMFEDPMANTSVPCGLDLVSLNIQRGRDHGLQGYSAWREYCGLSRPTAFTDLKDDLDPDALEQMSMLYASVDDIDVYSGALAEFPKGDGLLGPTFTCIIADQFVRLQRGDSYWYETSQTPQAFTKDQLQEIRKTSLAKVICECSDGVEQVQPDVMRAVGPDNPILSCKNIPGISLDKWKEESPVLQMKPAKTDWVALKAIINGTIQDIIYKINATKSGTAQDWINLHDYMNQTFMDIRNEIAQLNLTIQEESVTSSAEELEDIEAENEVRNFVTKSLAQTNDHILGLQDAPTVSADWLNFKRQINQSLNSAIQYFNNSVLVPGDTDWLVFKETVRDQFEQIKYQISTLKQEIISEKLGNKSRSALMDSTKIMNSTVLGNAENQYGIGLAKSRSKDLDSFKKYVNNSLSILEASIDDLQPTPANEDIQAIKTDWLDFKGKIMKSLSDAIKFNNENKPPPGDPAWAAFRNEIMDHFAEIKTQVASIKSLAAMKPVENSRPNVLGSKNEGIKSIDLVANKPIDRLYSGNVEKTKIDGSTNKTFADIKKNIANMEMKSVVPTIPYTDWVNFKSEINDSIMHLIDVIKSQNSTDWKSFRTFVNDSFTQIKKDISTILINNNLPLRENGTEIVRPDTNVKSLATVTEIENELPKSKPITRNSTRTTPRPEISELASYKKAFSYEKKDSSDSEFYRNVDKPADPKVSTQLLNDVDSSYAKLQTDVPEWISYKQYVSEGLSELQNMIDTKKQEWPASSARDLAVDYFFVNLYVLTTVILTIN